MPIRITGMNSGLDTEAIIQEMVKAKKTKVDDLKKAQTKLEWKQEAWKTLNAKVYKLYTGNLSDLQYQSSYYKKITTASNSNAVSVIADTTAMNSVQNLKIKTLAKTAYMTGSKMETTDGSKLAGGSKVADKLGIEAGSKFSITTNGKTKEITIDNNTTMDSLVSQLKSAGVNASFDVTNQRLFISANEIGAAADFSFEASNESGTDALSRLGILTSAESTQMYQKYLNMDSDPSAKAAAVDERLAFLISQHTAQRDSISAELGKLNTKQSDLVNAYENEYGSGDGTKDITDKDFRDTRRAELNDKIEELSGRLADPDTELTDEEKAELTNELNKAKGELSYIDGYETNEAAIEAKQIQLDGYAYLNDETTARDALIDEATAYIDEKIAAAKEKLDGSGNLKNSSGYANKIDGVDSEIELNGATFTSSGNTFVINGLTITCKEETGDQAITLTTQDDVSGIYDMIKNFITEYNALINEMDKLYNADSSKGYEPLTEDEKEEMSESEIEKWETKIKDSLLRRDSALSTVASTMKTIMASGFSVNGEKMYLSTFGIETLGYFNAADNEKNAYHIAGDSDSKSVKNETNKLLAMINTDPNAVTDFFTELSKSLYGKMNEMMRSVANYRSLYSVYDDKKMKSDYDNYSSKIKSAEQKLKEYEDKWYKKFSGMETALAKMQSNASAITSLLGGS